MKANEENKLVDDYNNAKQERDLLRGQLDGLLNGGLTETALLNKINGASTANANSLLAELLGYSPFLSAPMLEAFAARDDLFAKEDIAQLCAANPDALASKSLLSVLEGKLDAGLLQNVMSNIGTSTERTELVAALTMHQLTMHQSANRILKSTLADTTFFDLDKYRLWLDNKESLEAKYELLGTYLETGDVETAKQILDNIPTAFALEGEQLYEHGQYTLLFNVLTDAEANGMHYSALDNDRVKQVRIIAEQSADIAGTAAKGLLNMFYGYQYDFVPQDGNANGQNNLLAPPAGNASASATQLYQPLSAWPNPAKAMVTFRYTEEEGQAYTQLMLFNKEGIMVKSFDLADTNGSIEWKTDGMASGIYYCGLFGSGNTSVPLKLVLVK